MLSRLTFFFFSSSSPQSPLSGVFDDYLYMFGGGDGQSPLDDLYSLHLSTFTWKKIPKKGREREEMRGRKGDIEGDTKTPKRRRFLKKHIPNFSPSLPLPPFPLPLPPLSPPPKRKKLAVPSRLPNCHSSRR